MAICPGRPGSLLWTVPSWLGRCRVSIPLWKCQGHPGSHATCGSGLGFYTSSVSFGLAHVAKIHFAKYQAILAIWLVGQGRSCQFLEACPGFCCPGCGKKGCPGKTSLARGEVVWGVRATWCIRAVNIAKEPVDIATGSVNIPRKTPTYYGKGSFGNPARRVSMLMVSLPCSRADNGSYIAVSINWGLLFVSVLRIRALLFGVCIRAP